MKRTWGIFLLIILVISVDAVFAQDEISVPISLADTSSSGSLPFYNLEGWQFSFEAPYEIKDRRNLTETRPVDIRNILDLKSDPKWDDYGWFELEFTADSTIAGIPWVFSHRGYEPVRIWLNGVLILTNGKPSKTEKGEKLSRLVNSAQTGIILREGVNYILVEYSGHTTPKYLTNWQWFDNGLHLILYPRYEPFQRRHRAFVFGGALMLLLLLLLFHVYLGIKFSGEYHTYVALMTFSMLVLAFTTLSDTMIDWTYSFMYFYEYSYMVSLVFVAYFYLIAVRMIFSLEVPWRTLSFLCGVFIISGIAALYVNRSWINIIHPAMLISTMIYVFYSLYQAKKKDPDTKIWIISTGIIGTVLGSVLYTLVYVAFNIDNHVLFILSIILSFTGVPISLTFNVARGYANLIFTLETKVKTRTAQLEAANEYQNRFFANISHEFRTPLTISEGLINKVMRLKEYEPGKIQYDLSVAKRNMVRLHDMVDQIIDLTKSDQKHLTLNRKYYQADKLTSISVESFRSLAEFYGHSFVFQPDAKDVILYVDRSKVEIMINNLISNAIKFTPDGGSILVKTQVSGNTLKLFVQDTGSGIPAGEEEAIFERFHRIKRDDADYVEGMGVGLELSRTLARLHSGDIVVDTSYEGGACFVLTLPVVDIKESDISPILDSLDEDLLYVQKELETVNTNESFDILLVEDNPDMMEYVSEILGGLGNIKKAGNGKEALTILKTYTPDIIVTDLMMPVMGGLELVEALKAHEAWNIIPVMVLTAKALEEDKLHLMRIGVVDYITKPFLPEQLVLKVKNLLDYYARRKAIRVKLTAEEVPKDTSLSEKAAAYISKNLSNTNLSVDLLANEFSQSRRSFYRNLQVETGMSPGEFIREVRLTSARAMIASNKNLRLEELATAVGYKSATSFRKVYEERFGEHPLG